MVNRQVFEEFSARVNEVLAQSPAKDVEKNIRALMSSFFARMDLVTREEFDVQQAVLARTREKLAKLEVRLAELEQGNRREG
ncbi:MAG TPA: accessory factor UbiK family protein [Pelomicrobium sp.]|nr:accessory factor UbiK family protein [Pelomicrobium sp.]